MNQVIVVGGGLGGLSAAHTIMEHGIKVCVVDKSAFFGGNSTKATSGINGALTKSQRKLKIADSPEIFEEDCMKGGASRPHLVKVLTNESAPAVDWIVDSFGIDLSLVSRLGGHSMPRTHRGKERFPGMTITYGLMEKLEEIAEESDRAKIHLKTKVTKLLTDSNGDVCGCECVSADGKTWQEHGPVVIATGGFGADFTADSLLATKFEFGYVTDKKGKEKLIYMDEVGTPDSSRIWDGPAYRNNGKVVENSKEGFRQLLLKHFPDPDIFTNKDRMAERKKLATDNLLPQSVLMEVSKTYSDIAEKITGSKLRISEDPRGEIMTILDVQYGLIKHGHGDASSGKPLVVIAAGSDSDMPHLETLKKEVGKFKIDAEIRICSAHKQPAKLQSVIEEYNNSKRPIMMVGCAGGTDALSGTASYLAKFPVVSCPPDGMNSTCLTNPPGSSNAFIVKPANIGKFAAQMFAKYSAEIDEALQASIAEKIVKLEKADEQLAKRRRVSEKA